MTRPIETDDVVGRLRNASKLAQKKYVANSSELFDLAASRIAVLEGLVDLARKLGPRVAQMMDSIKAEWSQSNDWTEWDQQVRDETTAMMRAVDASLIREGENAK